MLNIKPPKEVNDTALGLVFFIIAFFGALVNLPSFLLIRKEGVSFSLCIIWRYIGLLLGVSVFFLIDIFNKFQEFARFFARDLWVVILLSLYNCFYVFLVYFAVSNTYVAHTLLLCSIATTFSSTWKIVRNEKYTSIEYIGIGINVFGAYLCCCEGEPDSIQYNHLFKLKLK